MNNSKTTYIIIVLIFIFLNLGIFSLMMVKQHWDDENMYVSAGVLIQNYSLYKDFAFLQMPYLPHLYGIIFSLTGTTHYLLIAEVINFFFMALSSLLIYIISYRFSKNILIALAILLLFLFNDIMTCTMEYSANAIVPIAFSLSAFYLFINNSESNSINIFGLFFSGIFSALAIGTKLYYAVTLPPFFIASLCYPKEWKFKQRFLKVMLPLSLGVIIGLMPVFYYYLKDIEIFMFNNLGYHKLNTIYREMTGFTHAMSLFSKIEYGMRILKSPANTALLIGALFLLFILIKQRLNEKELFRKIGMENLLLILLVLFTAIAAFIPTPLWLHYFALPFPFVILLLPYWYSRLITSTRNLTNFLIVCLVLVTFLGSGSTLFNQLNYIFHTNQWSSLTVHHTAEELENCIGTMDENDKVATLYPLYALEGELSIYKELSASDFIFRLGKLLPGDIRNKYSYISSDNIFELFEREPPKAILVDIIAKPELYKPFVKYAEEHDYQKIQKDFNGMILYIQKEN